MFSTRLTRDIKALFPYIFISDFDPSLDLNSQTVINSFSTLNNDGDDNFTNSIELM